MALAAVGFIALVIFGIYLAVYSARYVPGTVSRIGAAAVSLGSIFHTSTSSIAVVPVTTGSTTIAFGTGTTTATTTTTVTKPVYTAPTAGQQTTGSYQIGGSGTATLTGLPDLAVTIDAIGYLTTDSAASFVQSATVPAGYRPAVQFTVKNIGTNVAGSWSFSASIPTTTNYVYDSVPQQSLNPGDSIDYTLGFDDANVGSNEPITIHANYNNTISESNTANDSITASVNVQ
jgi:hypothetical protein